MGFEHTEYDSVYDWITHQPWSAESTRAAFKIVQQREEMGKPPLTFTQWMAWVRGRRG
jgi:hypothetical protein